MGVNFSFQFIVKKVCDVAVKEPYSILNSYLICSI